MEEKSAASEGISDQELKDAIKVDCGIQKYLYHGTKKYTAYQIKQDGIKIGDDIGYLGRGFYCYHLDQTASKIWAEKRHPGEKVAILTVIANLGNVFFVCQELHRMFQNKATEVKEFRADVRTKIGYIIERFIKEIIEPDYKVTISTIGQAYVLGPRDIKRAAMMYCLRDPDMVKKIDIYWEAA